MSPARLAVRVQGCDQREHILRTGRRADLDGYRVADPARELDVGAAGSTGALADPQQVSRQIIGEPAPRVDPGQRPLIVKEQRLVAGVELHRAELFRVAPQACMKAIARSISPASRS